MSYGTDVFNILERTLKDFGSDGYIVHFQKPDSSISIQEQSPYDEDGLPISKTTIAQPTTNLPYYLYDGTPINTIADLQSAISTRKDVYDTTQATKKKLKFTFIFNRSKTFKYTMYNNRKNNSIPMSKRDDNYTVSTMEHIAVVKGDTFVDASGSEYSIDAIDLTGERNGKRQIMELIVSDV